MGLVGRAARIGRGIRRAERPEGGGIGPDARGGVRDEARIQVHRLDVVRVDQTELAGLGVEHAELVLLEVAEPARALRGIGPEDADVDLVEVRAAHVDGLRVIRIIVDILHVRHRCQVIDSIDAVQGHSNCLQIKKAAMVELDILPKRRHHHIEDADFDAFVTKLIHHMRTDKT